MSRNPETLSISHLAKYGHFEELQRRVSAGAHVDPVKIFERAVTDFRTVRRNSGHLKILKWCVDSGIDFDRRVGWLNQNVVCLAAACGNNEVVQYMLQKERPDNPFVWASVGECESLERYAGGHDLSALQDENGFNLLFNCAESGLGRRDRDTRQRLTRSCRLLLAHGVSPLHEVDNKLPISPAFLCASYGGNSIASASLPPGLMGMARISTLMICDTRFDRSNAQERAA